MRAGDRRDHRVHRVDRIAGAAAHTRDRGEGGCRGRIKAHDPPGEVLREHGVGRLPVDANTVDVVISNCVLNLVPNKAQAFAEMFRVLRPGGRFCVSDIVATGELPRGVRDAAGLYVGCIAGAMPGTEYLRSLEAAGFQEVAIVKATPIELPDEALSSHMQDAKIDAFRASGATLKSVTVIGASGYPLHSPSCN